MKAKQTPRVKSSAGDEIGQMRVMMAPAHHTILLGSCSNHHKETTCSHSMALSACRKGAVSRRLFLC
jgi:hypothetical protein